MGEDGGRKEEGKEKEGNKEAREWIEEEEGKKYGRSTAAITVYIYTLE